MFIWITILLKNCPDGMYCSWLASVRIVISVDCLKLDLGGMIGPDAKANNDCGDERAVTSEQLLLILGVCETKMFQELILISPNEYGWYW